MTEVIGTLKVEYIREDYKRKRVIEAFAFFSDILGTWRYIPVGFVFDEESVPLIKGTNPEAGGIHDLVSRRDFWPDITKQQAADIYEEFQLYYDKMEKPGKVNKVWDWIRRKSKTTVVRVWPGYWHKLDIMATHEEVVAGTMVKN